MESYGAAKFPAGGPEDLPCRFERDRLQAVEMF
jgi:hypothetical protein